MAALANAFDTVLRILQDAGEPLAAADVKKALQDGGMSKADADKAWPAIQKRLKSDDRIVVDGTRYGWTTTPEPAEALEQLLSGDLTASQKAALAEVIRAALSGQDSLEDPANPEDTDSAEDVARQRQAGIDAVRLLAELASEVEELIANETDAPVLIRQVRAWVKRSGLDPVGKAGEETKFDRKQHQAIVGRISDGASVIVVRPGYIWKTNDEDVLLGKAVVEE